MLFMEDFFEKVYLKKKKKESADDKKSMQN